MFLRLTTKLRKMKKLICAIILIFIVITINAQDPIYSQFYANKIYLNPAFAGANDGLSFNLHYRNQWRSIPRPFNTKSASVELQEPCMGTGFALTVFNDEEGEGALETTGGSLIYAYILRLNDLRLRLGNRGSLINADVETNIHFGIEAGFLQKSIYWQKLHFSDEIDPIYGFTQASAVQNLPTADRLQFGDLGAGIILRQNYYTQDDRFKKTPIRFAAGYSMKHILEPAESLYRIYTVLPRRQTIHFGLQIPFTAGRRNLREKFTLLPHFKYEWQGKDSIGMNRLWAYGMYVLTPRSIYFGVFRQHNSWAATPDDTKSIVVTMGTTIERELLNTTIGLSYDFNYAGLGSSTRGVWEVSLRFQMPYTKGLCGVRTGNIYGKKRSKRTSGERIMDCDSFF